MNMKSAILYRLSPIRRRQRSLYPERFREKIKAYVKRADTCSLGHGTWILGGDSTRAARVRADDAFLRPLRNSPDLSTHKMTTMYGDSRSYWIAPHSSLYECAVGAGQAVPQGIA
jgi:hypothetical protein